MTLSPANSHGSGYPLGLTGAVSPTRYVGGTALVAPTTGTFAVGDFVVTQDGKVFACTVAGSPGTWVQVGGSTVFNTVVTKLTGGDFSTASVTFVDVTSATGTITVAQGSRILVAFSGTGGTNGALGFFCVDIVVGGVNQGGTAGLTFNRNALGVGNEGDSALSTTFLTAAQNAGAVIVKVQARVSGGTGVLYASATAPLILSLLEVPV